MRYNLILLQLIILLSLSIKAFSFSEEQLENTQISLLTYSPGEELYALFGHSSIRVYNSELRIDDVYNYGTFDFNQPNFYLRFTKGDLKYSLTVVPFEREKRFVISQNQSLIESPLNLTPSEKAKVISFLVNNARPENKDYVYDFQYDNCSSRILDLINSEIGDKLSLNPEVLPVARFRRLINPYLKYRPWADMGIDLILGLRADRIAKQTEPAFLPDILHLFIKNYKIKRSGVTQNLSAPDKILVSNFSHSKNKVLTPGIVFWPLALLMFISALIDSYFRKIFYRFGNMLLLLIGLFSLFLIFLWFFPDHQVFANNTDLLWANPLLLLVFFLRKSSSKPFVRSLIVVSFGFTVLGILSALIIERNPDLAAVASLPAAHLFSLLRKKKPKNLPR